ncbi:MAG: glycosyltransferase, partial [Deltaproteobacteria bacterium]|nr:glycosyltransferase [Deltaproteobacteria bacterium]
MSGKVVAVVPAYNEGLAIGSVVLETKKHVEEVIVVDDGSTDRTAEVARLAGATVLRLDQNSGKARALMKGFEYARQNEFAAAVMLDGDGQHDPDELPSLVYPILNGEADFVIGSRYLQASHATPGYRRTGQRLLDVVTNMSTDQKVTDSQSGFRALSGRAMDNLDFESKGFNIESDMIVHFSQKGLKMKEVPIGVHYDVPKKHTRNPLSHGIVVMGRVVKLVSQSRPLMILGVPGFLLVLLGSIFGTASFLEIMLFNWTWLFQTVIAILLFIIGLVLCISALVLNSIAELLSKVTERVGPKG